MEDVYIDKFFVWNNTYTDCKHVGDSLGGDWNDYSDAAGNARSVDFSSVPVFGRAPNLSHDGFAYAKYDCPHPLAELNGTCGDGGGPKFYNVGHTDPPVSPDVPTPDGDDGDDNGCFMGTLF